MKNSSEDTAGIMHTLTEKHHRGFIAVLLFLACLIISQNTNAQIGVHTDTPDGSSAMDIYATNKGLLIPRVTLTSNLSDPSPVTSPATGLMVFNSGANQPVGFYYWNGTAWTPLGSGGSGGGDYWSLTGNSGTNPGTHFLGTTDDKNFLVFTNNSERMRFENDGQVLVGGTTPNNSTDMFTVFGNSTQNSAINAYSPRTGFLTDGGRYGILATVDTVNGYHLYGRNLDALGYGIITVGGGISPIGIIGGRCAGVSTYGYDGLHSWGKNANGYGIFAMGSNAAGPFNLSGRSAGVSAVGNDGIIARGSSSSGRGIIAVGSGIASPSISLESEGGAFTGHHGVYARGTNTEGIGIIGIGSNYATYSTIAGGLGGSFVGNYGLYTKGLNSTGVGVVAVGSAGAGYFTVTGGSGGSFTGYHGSLSVGTNSTAGTGVIGAGNNGSYVLVPSGSGGSFTGDNVGVAGFATVAASGTGIVGAGNNQAAWIPANGAGGAFTGNIGAFGKSTNTTGTGIVGLGNNLSNPGTFTDGSGGAFTGTMAGSVNWATSTTGTGVIGAGNNVSPVLYTGGCGGAFTGLYCGVYGYASDDSNGDHFGGYFAAGGASNKVGYAYVGGRYGNLQCKIIGVGTVNTIVKNTTGEKVALTCPEAPEAVFQDFGIGQLVDGMAHITLDPDLSINISVNEDHPLKVYITPEGDCKGVYVTNKSAEGFDVIELQGGKSNVPFAWQIVATRANEEFVLDDGGIQISDYSQRFPPAPGPLPMVTQERQPNGEYDPKVIKIDRIFSGRDDFHLTKSVSGVTLEYDEDIVIEKVDDPNE